MLSGGMSFRRLMWPYFLGATFITALSLVMSLWLIPISQRDCVAFEQKHIRKRTRDQYDRHIYRQIEPGTFAYIRGFSKHTSVASFFALEQYDGSVMVRSLESSDVKFDPDSKRWSSNRYVERVFDEEGNETFTQHRNLDTLINLDVVELGRLNELLKTMNIVELNRFREQQMAKGSDSLRQIEVEHHTRYSYPFGTFILTLIGVSLSSRKVRGGTGLHIGIGIALCFSYIMLTRVFEEFAKGGSMPTLLAVWVPNIIYLIVGIYLYRKAPK
jgi:lipopolysaccharide export system permease protein